MDGGTSPPVSPEEDTSDGGAVDLDPRRPAAPPMIVPGVGKTGEGQGYLDSLLIVSLQLIRKGYAPHVRHQGLKLMLHLLRFRWDEHIEEWSAGRHCLFVTADPGVAASAVNSAAVTSSTVKGNDGFSVSDDICEKIMDISLQRILKKSAAMSPESLELLSDELYRNNDIIQDHNILLDLIRFIAYETPMIAASRAVQRISYIIRDAKYSKDLTANGSAQLVLETVVNALFDDSTKIILETDFPLQGLYKMFAGLLMQLLSLKWIEADVVILQCYLNALCPFLKHFPDAFTMVLTKLLELLSSVNDNCHSARMQICRCVIHICQAVDGPSLPPDIKDLFSVAHITEDDVLAFVASEGSAYSVEQKQGREGNQDGDAKQQLHADWELQTHVSSLMQVAETQLINIFDDCGQGNNQEQNTVHGTVTRDFEVSGEAVDEGKMDIMGKMSPPQENSYLLRVEHNILSEAFAIVSSFPRIQHKEHLLADLLNTLNKIWTQTDWKYNYMRNINYASGLFADDEFRRTVQLLVKSFEELIRNKFVESAGDKEGCSSASSYHMHSYSLPKLMLPLILQILHCIQMLWEEPISCDLSGVKAEDINYILESGKLSNIDEANTQLIKKNWSLEIQETGYSVIGLCASIEGAFHGLLNNSFIINVLTESLRSMGFNHLGKLIQLVFIPLVTYCPYECWDDWTVKLLEPLFSCCEDILYRSWFTFLHEGRPKCPYFFGNLSGPEEIVNQFEMQLLLKFTRSLSDLLGILASERLNSGLSHFHRGSKTSTKTDVQDLKSISSTSIIGYLLFYDCFWMLSMYLLGCLVDYQAAEKALPFCHALVQLAIATNHERLKQFILNEMLPTITLLLGDDLNSAISKLHRSLNATRMDDARKLVICLCQEIYEAYIDKKVIDGDVEDTEKMSGRFEDWLRNEFTDLHMHAACSVPNDFPKDVVWNWEFNEEFKRYLPAYMNMLVVVDGMDECLEVNYLESQILFENLKPEFKSKYGINSCAHPYLQTMYRMLSRKRHVVYYRSRTEWITRFLTELITHKPYIKCGDSYEVALDILREMFGSQRDPMLWNPTDAIRVFCDSILFYREPQFHPLIRESRMELLKALAVQFALAEESAMFKPLEPDFDDFVEHLQPYAWMYIRRKKEESDYNRMKEQAHLHEEFDNHLASGTLDHRMNEFIDSKDDFVHKVVGSDFKGGPFATLEPDLIKMSFERRAKLVKWEHQLASYSQCLASLMKNDEMKDELTTLMNLLNEEDFFIIDSKDWGNKVFSYSIEKFNEVVFSGKCMEKSLVIRGIMDYHKILQLKDVDWQDAFKMVVSNTNYWWKENLQKFWVSTRHYEQAYYYETFRNPLQKVYLLHGAPQPKYG